MEMKKEGNKCRVTELRAVETVYDKQEIADSIKYFKAEKKRVTADFDEKLNKLREIMRVIDKDFKED